MRIGFEVTWKIGIVCVILALGTGTILGSQAFPKTVIETQTLLPDGINTPQLAETDCVDVNTMDAMLMNQIIFEKTNCWQEILQDENGQTIIIGNCNIPQRGE